MYMIMLHAIPKILEQTLVSLPPIPIQTSEHFAFLVRFL